MVATSPPLPGNRVDDFFTTMTDIHAPESTNAIEKPITIKIVNVSAFTTGNDRFCLILFQGI